MTILIISDNVDFVKEEFSMAIADRIVSLLKFNAYTQRDLCLYLGLPPSTVNDWLKRHAESIPSQYVVPLCKFFQISLDELLTGEANGSMLLSLDERNLITLYRTLDHEAQTMIMATAIQEKRRAEECQRNEKANEPMG